MLLKNYVADVEGRTSKPDFLSIYLAGEIGFVVKKGQRMVA